MITHKYMPGTTIYASDDDDAADNWGNGSWVYGQIVALCFINGCPAYDIIDRNGNILHNIFESTIKDASVNRL